MIIKAEMASEIIRSRIHTARTGKAREGTEALASVFRVALAAAGLACSAMFLLILYASGFIRIGLAPLRVSCWLESGRFPGLCCREIRVTIMQRRNADYAEARIDSGLSPSDHFCFVGPLGDFSTGDVPSERSSACLQCGPATQGYKAAADSC